MALDGAGNKGEAQIDVSVVPPKDYGAQCKEHLDCKSILCASDPGRGLRFCTQACKTSNNNCPREAPCLPVQGAGMELCGLPLDGIVTPDNGDDCSVGGPEAAGPGMLALIFLLALARRRRR